MNKGSVTQNEREQMIEIMNRLNLDDQFYLLAVARTLDRMRKEREAKKERTMA